MASASPLPDANHGLPDFSLGPKRTMNSEPHMNRPASSPAGAAIIGMQQESPAESCEIYAAIFRIMDQIQLRYCLLGPPAAEKNDLHLALELTVHPEDHAALPLLIQML